MTFRLIRLVAVLALALGGVLGSAAGQAGEIGPKIAIDKSKGQCVRPRDEMRRTHMQLLKHRRDETMYRGVRGGKVSLRACMECHAVKGEDGKFLTVKSPKHFCRVCHDYAAVKPDCWDCHVSVPDAAAGQAMLKLPGHSMHAEASGLVKYLQGGKK